TPEERQTALFSATLPKPIRKLADKYMREPQAITTSPKQLTVANTEQRYYTVRQNDKLAALTRLLEMEDVSSALIFARTKIGAANLAEALFARGFLAEALHGDLQQRTREIILGRFRRGQITLLVATDVAARGLDIKGISHVFNYDLPSDPEYYVHRIGRTGRAGETGIAISLVTPQERGRLRRIERLARRSIPSAKLPTTAQIIQRRDQQFMDQLADQMAEGDLQRERSLVEKLAQVGCDPLDLAAAALQLARAGEQQRPIEEIAEIRMSKRHAKAPRTNGKKHYARKNGHEPGMVRLSLNVGRSHSLRPGEIVGAIAGTAKISGKSIGAITINNQHTLIDVAQQHEQRVLRKMRGWKLRGQAVVLQRAG
ncbi:MAG: DEAD/DEAH box helicase, partial [Delftia sp.]|nr:DEAD/DEAH box helicase [Delftia sp.]